MKKKTEKVIKIENRKPGSAKVMIIISAMFDEPLECFSDYI